MNNSEAIADDFPECEPFRGVDHQYQNCTYQRLTPEKCDQWRINVGLLPRHDPTAAPKARPPVTINGAPITGHPSPPSIRPLIPPAQVGDVLEQLLHSLGITELAPEMVDGAPCPPCQLMKSRLNNLGIAGCRGNIEEFAAELRERASEYSTWDWTKAAANAVLSGLALKLNPLDPFGSLLEEACRIEEARIQAAMAAMAAARPVAPTPGLCGC